MRRAALYVSYFGVTEALVESQVLGYLGELARGGVEVHLLTFEPEPPDGEDEKRIASRLLRRGIRWHWRRYHRRPSLPATVYDVAVGSLAAIAICREHDIPLVHARSHVAAAIGLVAKRVLGTKLLFDLRGLLADEYADSGHWSRVDLKFRLTKRMERRFYERADALVVLTDCMKRELRAEPPFATRPDTDVAVIPCCVDLPRFRGAAAERDRVRAEKGWSSRIVLTYLGRIGAWYRHREMAELFAVLRSQDPRFFFQVLTPNDAAPLEAELASLGVRRDAYCVARAAPGEVPALLAASDAGICFLSGSAARASSPTKIGEYLASGLPVVTNRFGGDYEDAITRHQIGIVVENVTSGGLRDAADRLRALLADPRAAGRCRAFAERELSLETIGGPRYAVVYERLLAGEHRAGAEPPPRCRESA